MGTSSPSSASRTTSSRVKLSVRAARSPSMSPRRWFFTSVRIWHDRMRFSYGRVVHVPSRHMKGCAPLLTDNFTLEDVVLDALEGLDVPIALGLSRTHVLAVRDVALRRPARGWPAERTRDSRCWRRPSYEGPSLDCRDGHGLAAGLLHELATTSRVRTRMSIRRCRRARGAGDPGAFALRGIEYPARRRPRRDRERAVVAETPRWRSSSIGVSHAEPAAVIAEQFIRGRTSLVVARHSWQDDDDRMLAFILHHAGVDPSFLIGGVPVDFERSYRLAKGPHFVIEGDEYDTAFFDKRPKFVHYLRTSRSSATSNTDHADIYPDLAAVQTAFVRLMHVIPRRGLLVAGIESPALREILPKAFCRVETFARHGGRLAGRGTFVSRMGGTSFRLVQRTSGGRLGHGLFEMTMTGEHNVRNAVAAVAAANAAASPAPGARGARRLSRVKRRLEAARRGARRLRLRRLRAPSHRGAGNAGRATCGRQRRAPDRGVRAAVLHVAYARLPGGFRPRLRRGGPGDHRRRASTGEGTDGPAPLGGGSRARRSGSWAHRPVHPTVDGIVERLAPTLQTGDRVIICRTAVSAASTPDCCRRSGCAAITRAKRHSPARSSESSVRLKLKQRIDERCDRRALREDHEEPQQAEHHDRSVPATTLSHLHEDQTHDDARLFPVFVIFERHSVSFVIVFAPGTPRSDLRERRGTAGLPSAVSSSPDPNSTNNVRSLHPRPASAGLLVEDLVAEDEVVHIGTHEAQVRIVRRADDRLAAHV